MNCKWCGKELINFWQKQNEVCSMECFAEVLFQDQINSGGKKNDSNCKRTKKD